MSRRAAKILRPALLCATIVFGLVGASAASLNITSTSLVAFTFDNVEIVTGQTYVLYPSHDSFTNDKAKNTNYGSAPEFAVVRGTQWVTIDGSSVQVKKGNQVSARTEVLAQNFLLGSQASASAANRRPINGPGRGRLLAKQHLVLIVEQPLQRQGV